MQPRERTATVKYEDMTAGQKERIDGKTPEEILEIAKAEGYSLSDEELEAISGGVSAWNEYVLCPKCNGSFKRQEGKDWQKCPGCGSVYLRPLD